MIKKIAPFKKKPIRVVFIVITSLFITLSAIIIFIGVKWKPILKETIKNTVIDVSDSLYHVDFSDIKMNLFTGSVSFKNIEIKTDSITYQKMVATGQAPEHIFHLKIKQLHIKNIKPFKVYLHRRLDINSIKIIEPELTLTYNRLKNKTDKSIDTRTTYEKIKNTLQSAKLENLFLNEIAFVYIDNSLKQPEITKINRVSIHANDILIDSISQFDTTRIFHSKDINVQLNDFEYTTVDSLYDIQIKHLTGSTRQKKLIVNGVQLTPRYKEMAFSNLFERQHERYSLKMDTIKLEEIDISQLIDYRNVNARKLQLIDGNLSVFLNRSKPKKTIDKGINFPHLALKRINWTINTDTIDIKKINVAYTEYNPKTNSNGTVFFNNLQGKILNVTNDSALLQKTKFIDANLHSLFLGKGLLNVNIRFDMLASDGGFSYSGSLKNMELQAVNSLSKPLAKVTFGSGKLNELDFSVKGNLKGAGGTVKILYEDMRIGLMKKDSENENFKRMALLSFLANNLVLKDSNPLKGEAVRVTHPYYERPREGSFFNLMWKVLFLGFKETIGITKQKEAQIKEASQAFKELMKQREERRLKRQLRKEQEDKN
ncbi:hypothetical protein [Pseudopedobacter beijingensis]|uniref:AsmA-like C-terminal region n=1 Tax=Pseudopedobacter beijingensis TaxID=1207056 RepID=A0ABW4I9B6_9SPHI